MTEKKNAINISIIMIFFSILIPVLCWPHSNSNVPALIYTLSTGIFGSSFATLWIFVYEYNRSKKELLKAIFDETVSITENNTLSSLHRFGYYEPTMKDSMIGKYYIPSTYFESVSALNKPERCHYEMCRFVDGVLDIGQDRVNYIGDLIEEINFWTDTFRYRKKLRNIIIEKLELPLYELFIYAPGKEDGHIFRYFKDFKDSYAYTADLIYPIVAELDKALHIPESEDAHSQTSSITLTNYMHEQLWLFRDAFYSPYVCRKQRREAKQAFLKGTPYPYIR